MSTVAPSRLTDTRGRRESFVPHGLYGGSGGLGQVVASTLQSMEPPLLLERLTERLATSDELIVLYAALLTKSVAAGDPSRVDVEAIMRDEREHAASIRRHLGALGLDPLISPAPRNGETTIRILQIIADPRTTVAQAFSAVLGATLSAVGEWEFVVRTARDADEESMAADFERIRSATEAHVHRIRSRAGQVISA